MFGATSLSLLLMLAFFSESALSWVRIGNGGSGVVCRDPKTRDILQVETLDLYEGRVLFGFSYNNLNQELSPLSTLKVVEWADEALGKFLSESGARSPSTPKKRFVDLHYSQFLGPKALSRRAQPIPPDTRLNFVPDLSTPFLPANPNCQLEQIALFDHQSTLWLDPSLWEKLDSLNKAALLFHEALNPMIHSSVDFPTAHQKHEQSSDLARYFVAYFLSDQFQKNIPVASETQKSLATPSREVWLCRDSYLDQGFSFYWIIDHANSSLLVDWLSIEGRTLISEELSTVSSPMRARNFRSIDTSIAPWKARPAYDISFYFDGPNKSLPSRIFSRSGRASSQDLKLLPLTCEEPLESATSNIHALGH